MIVFDYTIFCAYFEAKLVEYVFAIFKSHSTCSHAIVIGANGTCSASRNFVTSLPAQIEQLLWSFWGSNFMKENQIP